SRALVPRARHASRPRRPVLAADAARRRAGEDRDPRAAARWLARPLPRSDDRAVRPGAGRVRRIEQYARLRERGVDVALTVGPWTHIDLAGRGAGVVARETLDWFEEHLA